MTQEEFRAKWGSVLDGQGGAPPVAAPASTAQQTSQQASRQVRTRQAVAASGASPADNPLQQPLAQSAGNIQLQQPPAQLSSAEPEAPQTDPPWQGPVQPTPPPDPNSFMGRIYQQSRDVYRGAIQPLGQLAQQGLQAAGSAAGGVLSAGDQLSARYRQPPKR